METMRPYLQRIQLRWIAFWIVGILCGALLVVGVSTFWQSGHDSTAPALEAQNVQGSNQPAVVNSTSSNQDRADRIEALRNESSQVVSGGTGAGRTTSTGNLGSSPFGSQLCYQSSVPIGPGERDLFASGSLLSETCRPAD